MKTHGTIIYKDTTGVPPRVEEMGENTEVDYNSGKENEGGWEREREEERTERGGSRRRERKRETG